MAVSHAARACTGPRSWATRACPRSAWGAMTPAACREGRAAVRAGGPRPGGRLWRGWACRLRATARVSAEGAGRGPARHPGARRRRGAPGGGRARELRGGRGSACDAWGPPRRWPRGWARAGSRHVGRSPPPGGPHQGWHPLSRAQQRPPRLRVRHGACVSSQRVRAWRAGPGLRPCGEGLRGSRERGRPCVGVDERQHARGGEERGESIGCFGLPMCPPRVHVPACPDNYLPRVHNSTESRTVYL